MSELDFYLDKLEPSNIIAWILKNRIKNERGQPIQFEDYAFMIDPYLDWSPLQGARKAAQCGWSVMENLKLFYASRFGIPGYNVSAANVIYTLPTDQDVSVFVPSKTNLLIRNNPVLQEYIAGNDDSVDSIQRKQIGNSMVYFKGTKSKTAAIMLTADLLIHDESDRSDKNVVADYESRTGTSLYKGRWIFSNPSAPNMPADLMYQEGDQKHWFVKCEHCGHWQYMEWKKLSEHSLTKALHCYVDDIKYGFYVCSNCGKTITDENRRRGRWVPKFKGRDASSYWVSQLMYPWIHAKDLIKVEKNKSKDYFMNFVLGLPYVGSDVVVDGQTIVANMVLDQVAITPGQCALGVDNGDLKHWVLGDKRGIIKYGVTRKWEDIEYIIKMYKPVTVIDLNPYPNQPRELAHKYRRVYCSFYVDKVNELDLWEWGQVGSDKAFMVYPARNRAFDNLIDYIAAGNLKFYGSKQYWEPYIKHWETMYRADVETASGLVKGVWETSTGEDHWAHATLYFYIALSKILNGTSQVSHQNALGQVQKDLGGIPTAPVPAKDQEGNDKPGTIQPLRNYLDPKAFMKKEKKPVATSGN